jgi:cell division septal protein FtsQ
MNDDVPSRRERYYQITLDQQVQQDQLEKALAELDALRPQLTAEQHAALDRIRLRLQRALASDYAQQDEADELGTPDPPRAPPSGAQWP